MSSKIIRKGPGIKVLKERVRTPGTVEVGIIGAGVHQDSDITVAGIGFIHEFGSPANNIPERSFLRRTIRGDRKEIVALTGKFMKKIQDGSMKMETALGLLGSFVADKVEMKIVSLKEPPNKPATIAAKRSSNPLIGKQGQLKDSITWRVNK